MPATTAENEITVSGAENPSQSAVNEDTVTFAGALAIAQSELDSARKELQKVTDELANLNDKYLRTLAEDVNFRKRMVREKEESQRYAVAALLQDIIPVLDDFDRGIASAEVSKNYDQLHEGVILIRRQLSQMLENKYSLKRIESKGAVFDPNKHEALFAEQADVEEAVVSEEYLPGYTLHDRVLRTSKVRVKMPSPKQVPQPMDLKTASAENSSPETQKEVDENGTRGEAGR